VFWRYHNPMNLGLVAATTLSYTSCTLCPRDCGVNRHAGERGFCGESDALRIASASIHRGEEPPITGTGGSGTIFVTGCTLRCSFCQNHQISQDGMGTAIDTRTFADICLALQNAGAENINLVTGSHAVPALARGIAAARERGLFIPTLWNSSAYERVSAVDLGSAYLNVYLPDLKTLDPALSGRYFLAPDYPAAAAAAILRMLELQPLTYGPGRAGKVGDESVLRSGVIIRHLVLPGHLESTRQVLRWFADHAAGRALLSLMTQYTPIPRPGVGIATDRFVMEEEAATVLAWLDELGIDDGFFQELLPGDDWLPDFRRANPFSSELSVPIWHWQDGFITSPYFNEPC